MLKWPDEGVRCDSAAPEWSQPESNVILDFHGDPRAADLVVFSDGNHHMALRYVRIFPEIFHMVPLGGTVGAPDPYPGNMIGFTHAGLIGDGGQWGKTCLDFLFTRQVADIYASHGLDAIFTPDY